jgi:1-deoxy-D-xylulose-5-phosphate reductoisomerase
MRRRVSLLGSTGSIGTQALEVVDTHPGEFDVVALAAGGANVALLVEQVRRYQPEVVAVADAEAGSALREALADSAMPRGDISPQLLVGPDAAAQAAAHPADVVLNGMTGSIGLAPTLAALKSGAVLALANKESLVAGGPLVKAAAAPAQIVPVDSEHSALAQCLLGGTHDEVQRLVLTASGGPFRDADVATLADVTPEAALNHPTWSMGPVVTINSATMVNKGLEVIEAHLLFDIPFDRIDVVVHPQSMVHSMVEFVDGSTLAQVSPPDMRLPIALGLTWPRRLTQVSPPCDWTTATSWQFSPLDSTRFPAVSLAKTAGRAGGTAPAVFNAANEECVAAFLAGKISFPTIVDTVSQVVDSHVHGHEFVESAALRLADVHNAEQWARTRARELVGV